MWIKTPSGARFNLNHVVAFTVDTAANYVTAHASDTYGLQVAGPFATVADAQAAIDNLILQGS